MNLSVLFARVGPVLGALVLAALLAGAPAPTVGASPAGASPGSTTTTSPGSATEEVGNGVRVQRDVTYTSPGGTDVTLDLYLPAPGPSSSNRRPAVIVVHGGGWEVGDKAGAAPLATAMAEAGWVAASINYRLNSAHPWPDQFDDVVASVRWMQDHATDHRVDPERIAVFGGSAGGHLAMLVGTNGVGQGRPPVRAVVSWSGPSDLRTIEPPDIPAGERDVVGPVTGVPVPVGCGTDPYCIGEIDPGVITRFMGCTLSECPERYAAASPAVQAGPSSAPMLLVNSETELVPVTQLYEMANALNRAGVTSSLLVVPGNRHADAYRDVALEPTVTFLRAHLEQDAARTVTPRSTPTTIAGSVALPPLSDGWELPNPSKELPRSLRGTTPWWRAPALGAGVLIAFAAFVALWRRRHRVRQDATA